MATRIPKGKRIVQSTASSKPNADPLKPSMTLLMKLGSIAVHIDEMSGPGGHAFDEIALEGLIKDPEIQQWITAMGALLPAKRRT